MRKDAHLSRAAHPGSGHWRSRPVIRLTSPPAPAHASHEKWGTRMSRMIRFSAMMYALSRVS